MGKLIVKMWKVTRVYCTFSRFFFQRQGNDMKRATHIVVLYFLIISLSFKKNIVYFFSSSKKTRVKILSKSPGSPKRGKSWHNQFTYRLIQNMDSLQKWKNSSSLSKATILQQVVENIGVQQLVKLFREKNRQESLFESMSCQRSKVL